MKEFLRASARSTAGFQMRGAATQAMPVPSSRSRNKADARPPPFSLRAGGGAPLSLLLAPHTPRRVSPAAGASPGLGVKGPRGQGSKGRLPQSVGGGSEGLWEAKLKKNSSTLFTTETRSPRRCTENTDASVKPPCPPCLRGETGCLAAAESLSESQSYAFFGASWWIRKTQRIDEVSDAP